MYSTSKWLKLHRFSIVIEKADGNDSAYSPDLLDGVGAVGYARQRGDTAQYLLHH